MLNLIRKEKVILRGLGRKGEGGREGGGQRQLLQRKGADRDGALQCNAEKVRQKHKNISRRQQHWVKCALCLSDVVVSDGFLAAPSCFSLLNSPFVLTNMAAHTNAIARRDRCSLFDNEK